MNTLNKFIYSTLLALCLFSNVNAAEPVAEQLAPTDLLYASAWTLVILNSEGLDMEKFPDRKPYLQFNKDGTFAANVGCNQIHGSFTLTALESINFAANMAATRMACPEYFMQLEDEFTNTLPKVKYWKIDNTKALYLLNDEKMTLAILTNITLN